MMGIGHWRWRLTTMGVLDDFGKIERKERIIHHNILIDGLSF
jgi:hypothetical protein